MLHLINQLTTTQGAATDQLLVFGQLYLKFAFRQVQNDIFD